MKLSLQVPKKIGVYTDKKTKVKSIALPFDFPNKDHGAIIITKLSKKDWIPSQDIKTITIEFND